MYTSEGHRVQPGPEPDVVDVNGPGSFTRRMTAACKPESNETNAESGACAYALGRLWSPMVQ